MPRCPGGSSAGVVGVGQDDARVGGELNGGRRVGEHKPGTGSAQRRREPGGRIVGVEREVGGARLEDAEHADDRVDAARQTQTDDLARAGTGPTEPVRESVGAAIELAVGECGIVGGDGGGVRGAAGVLAEAFVEAVCGVAAGWAGPLGEQGALVLVEEVDRRDPLARIGCHGGQHGAQVAAHPRDRVGVEQVGPVLDAPVDLRSGVVQVHGQVKRCGCPRGRHRAGGQPRQRDGLVEQFVADHHVEQWGAGEVAWSVQRVDEPFEGQVLVSVGAERDVAHPLQQFVEGRVTGQVGAQHERVDEAADQRFDLWSVPARYRGANRDVVLTAVTGQQGLQGGQQGHEQGGGFDGVG